MRKLVLSGLVLLVTAAAVAGGFVLYGLHEVASGRMGMTQIVLPSRRIVWVRRQTYAHKPEQLYLSLNDEYCAPYNRWRDYKLPASVTGDAAAPLIFSFTGDSIVVHAPEKPNPPWLFGPKTFRVEYEQLPRSEYATYATNSGATLLPVGWHRLIVQYGHNTCSL
jgi:hypothetical protein